MASGFPIGAAETAVAADVMAAAFTIKFIASLRVTVDLPLQSPVMDAWTRVSSAPTPPRQPPSPSIKRNGPSAWGRTEAAVSELRLGADLGGESASRCSCTHGHEGKSLTRELFRPFSENC